MSQEVISYFGFSCPFGGQFFVCEGNTTEFLGCCNSDPCVNDGVCPDDDLRVATFNKDRYEDLPREECAPGADHLWYTCAFNNPPFMGCCQENPCATGEGCATADLGPAFLAPEGAKDENRRTPLLSPPKATTAPTAKTKTPATTTESSATGAATGAEGALAGAAQGKDSSDHGLGTGAIIGIVLGCSAVIVILVAIIFYMCGSRRAKAKDEIEKQPVLQYAHAGQYNGDYQAVPSPYSDSYNPSAIAAGRYSNESYAKAKLSPHTANFQQPYTDESHEYPAQAFVAAGRHAAHRQYHGHVHGLGLAMEPVQELDSTAVTVELSAELEAVPNELSGTTRDGTEAVVYQEGPHAGQESSAGMAGAYGQEISKGQDDNSSAYGHAASRMESSNRTDPRGGYGYQAAGRGDETHGDLVSAVSYGQRTVETPNISTFGGSGTPMHGSPEMSSQPEWRGIREGEEARPTLRRVPRRPLGSPRPPSPSNTPGPRAVDEPF